MAIAPMTSMQRVLTTLSHQEPDRVPFFLSLTISGARELGISIKEYFSNPHNVVEGQLRMREKFGHDCLMSFMYSAAEIEAWGGSVTFRDDGPPSADGPLVEHPEQILGLHIPRIEDSPSLRKVLDTIGLLKTSTRDDVPIVAGVVSPFSLPIVQLGFEHYIEILYQRPELFEHLMRLNEEFCVAWANAQFDAGATALGYANPVSSPTIIPPELYHRIGLPVDKHTIARIKGGLAMNLASARVLPVLDDLTQTGVVGIVASVTEDLAEMKARCHGKLTVMGNLNGIEMRHWNTMQTEVAVKEAISKAGPGGGFILSDNHGEIPWQVSDEVLMTVSESVHRWGQYPLTWIDSAE